MSSLATTSHRKSSVTAAPWLMLAAKPALLPRTTRSGHRSASGHVSALFATRTAPRAAPILMAPSAAAQKRSARSGVTLGQTTRTLGTEGSRWLRDAPGWRPRNRPYATDGSFGTVRRRACTPATGILRARPFVVLVTQVAEWRARSAPR